MKLIFVFRDVYIYLNKDDSKNTLNLIFMFVNFCLKEQSVDLSLTRWIIKKQVYLTAQICPSICYYVVHLRDKKSVRGLSHPYSQMVDKKTRGWN